jgi:hypothetical protein
MPRPMSRYTVSVFFLAVAACSTQKAIDDGGLPDSSFPPDSSYPDAGDAGDSGPVDAGYVCHYDIDCAPWHGLCNDGGCDTLPPDGGFNADQTSNTCDPNPDSGDIQPCSLFATGPFPTYCTDLNSGNNLCYCHPDPYFDQGGVCYRAIPVCGACTDSVDCGGTQTDLNLNGATCQQVSDAGTFCLNNYSGGCSRAYTRQSVDGGDVCYPLCNTCPCIACYGNSDCKPTFPAKGVCGSSGACVAPCFTKRDCPGTDVCNVLGEYLDPALGLYYAGGQCGPSCGSTSDCAAYQAPLPAIQDVCIVDHKYPDGGPVLDDSGIPVTAARCRVDGCMNTDECIVVSTDAGSATWCDTWGGNQCVDNYCQIGKNDTGQGYYQTQCQKGYWCVNDAGLAPQDDAGPEHGICTVAPCYVLDSPLAACYDDNFCCGWGDGGFWSSPAFCNGPQGEADAGECFQANNPPWCVTGCGSTIGDPSCFTQYDIAQPGCFFEGFAGGFFYCEPACRNDWPWLCPAGFSCEPYDANFTYVWGGGNACDGVCPDTELDGGFTPAMGANPPIQTCYCPCVGHDISQCSGLGADPNSLYCDSLGGLPDSGGTCAYGNFCRPGGKGVCLVDGGA